MLYILGPLLHKGFYISDDGEWMVIRLSAFYQSLAENQFPVRLLGRLNNSFGYPVANFLYPGFMYIGSVLHFVGLSFVDSVKLILASSVIGACVFIYLFLRRSFERVPSLFGSLIFLGSPYLVYDLYKRGSVGEVLAFLPASMLLYAVSASLYNLVPLAVAFLIVSHNTLALLLGVPIAVYIAMRTDRMRLFWKAIQGIGLASFFWIPALIERTFVKFDTTSISDPTQYFIGSQNAWLLGIPVLIALMYAIWSYKNQKKEVLVISGILLVGYFFALPISWLFWETQIFPKLVQFPYRFLSITVLFGPWIAAYAYTNVRSDRRVVAMSICAILWVFGSYFGMQRIVYVDRPSGYYTTNEGTTTVHDEYLPRWVTYPPLSRALNVYEFISGDAEAVSNSVNTQLIDISIRAKQQSILQINKLYYPGWGITIDGVLVPIDYRHGDGTMRVVVPEGEHRVVVNFRETIMRFIADIISGIFGILYIWSIRPKKRHH
jgi:hypothetical protein